MIDAGMTKLKAAGVSDQIAEVTAVQVVQGILERMGGCELYLPSPKCYERELMYGAIAVEFTGTNHSALSEKYKCSLGTIYRAIRVMRERDVETLRAVG